MILSPVFESKMDTIPKVDAVAKYFPSILKITLVLPSCVNLCTRFRFSAVVVLPSNTTSHAEHPGLLTGVVIAWREIPAMAGATFISF